MELTAEAVQLERYRRMTPSEKLRVVQQLNELVDAAAMAGLRQRHPGADRRELFLRLTALKLPPDLMLAAYGWDPGVHGR